jgi:flavin-dependent dehydrogenase
MNLKFDYKIMIVGGGPAGISTWLHLNKYDQDLASKTILIEKEKYPRDKLCGGAIGSWGQDILKQLDIKINAPSIEIKNTEYRFKNEKFCNKEPGFLKIFRRIELDHELAKNALNRGLNLNQNERIQEISNKNKEIIVKTNKRKYKVKILVGADGALSAVRSLMNPVNKPKFATGIEIFAPFNPRYETEFNDKTAVLDFTSISEGLQGYTWHFPCIKDNLPYMNHGIFDSKVNTNKPRANIRNILTNELQSRKINCKPSCWSGHPIPLLTKYTTVSQPNIILVGDAAGIEPLLGGGIHLALSYGDIAALTILEAFEINNYTFDSYREKLETHIVGKYINKLTYLANEVYNKNMDILEAIRKIFKK